MTAFGILFRQNAIAQIPLNKNTPVKQNDPYYYRNCQSQFLKVSLEVKESIESTVIQYLEENLQHFSSPASQPKIIHTIESPGGIHFTFEQHFADMPVFQSQVKVNLNKTNELQSVFDNSWDTRDWTESALKMNFETVNLTGIIASFRKKRDLNEQEVTGRKVLAIIDETPVALAEIELWDEKTDEHLLLLTDNNLRIYLHRDLNTYHNLVSASAMVFIPDPVTSANVPYGTPYVNDNDNDVPVLNAERKQVTIDVTLDNGVYILENPMVRIADFSQPNIPPATSTTPEFHFTRAQSGFEDVNAFYHISFYTDYVTALGFDNLVDQQVWVDAHALDGKDQSQFSSHFLGPRLFFGNGGVDDAEDADVIVHEFGHAISYRASPGTNTGNERQSIDEGLGDYLATSYSKEIDTFNWKNMFSWDGHNEYWSGRTAVTTRLYPADLVGTSIHRNGEIYNAALMQIHDNIGREKTDKLLLQSLYGLAANMSMKAAAMLLYDADNNLFGGENFCVIYYALLSKGLTDTLDVTLCKTFNPAIEVSAGEEKTICQGDSVLIGDATVFNSNYQYRWSPQAGLGTPQGYLTLASPPNTITYTLEASEFGGSYNFSQVKINVLQCVINVWNSDGFKTGEDVLISFPYNSSHNIIELFDINGKRLMQITGLSDQNYQLSGNLLMPGVYVLRVKSPTTRKTQKLVKIR